MNCNSILISFFLTLAVYANANFVIEEIITTNEFCDLSNGTITVIVSGDPTGIEYSIDNGFTFQSSNFFDSVDSGDYLIVAKNSSCPSAVTTAQIGEVDIGGNCDDGNPNTINDVVQTDCTCAGSFIYDCPTIMANIGDTCDDGNIETMNDVIVADCSCMGNYDCPVLSLNIGDPCDDGDLLTMDDEVLADCTCAGSFIFDCPTIMANIGDTCDDGDIETMNDVIVADCSCLGSYDCPILSLNIGDPCDDSDATTADDEVLADCTCAGVSIFDCPSLMANIGESCDDGDPNTTDDTIDANCACAGLKADCMTAILITQECNDGDPCTINDSRTELPDGTICEDCKGELVDCDSGETITRPCDDQNELTENDVEILLACDGSICTACIGVSKAVKMYLPNILALSESGEDVFKIFSADEIPIIDFSIWDRWGNEIHSVSGVLSSDPALEWGIRGMGNQMNLGVYIYRIEYQNGTSSQVEFGQITVVR